MSGVRCLKAGNAYPLEIPVQDLVCCSVNFVERMYIMKSSLVAIVDVDAASDNVVGSRGKSRRRHESRSEK
jgi:hypothetical protein